MPLRTGSIVALLCVVVGEALSQPKSFFETDIRPVLARRCFECHDTGNPKGGVNLDNYKEQDRVIKDGQLWLKVLDQIRARTMPPKGEPRLPDSEYQFLVQGIEPPTR